MITEHAQAQVLRGARMAVYALAVQLAALGHWPGWAGLWALAPAAGETLLRELLPVKAIPAVSAVPTPSPAAGPETPGYRSLPDADGDTSTVRTHPGYGMPMQGVEVKANADGTFPPATLGNPPVPGQPSAAQITPEG